MSALNTAAPTWTERAKTSCRRHLNPRKQNRIDDQDFTRRVHDPLNELLEELDRSKMLARNLDSCDLDKRLQAEVDAIRFRRLYTTGAAVELGNQLYNICRKLWGKSARYHHGGHQYPGNDPRFPNEDSITYHTILPISPRDKTGRLLLLKELQNAVTFFRNHNNDLHIIFNGICSDESAAGGKGKEPHSNRESINIEATGNARVELDPQAIPSNANVIVGGNANFRLTPNAMKTQSQGNQIGESEPSKSTTTSEGQYPRKVGDDDGPSRPPTTGRNQQRNKAPDTDGPSSRHENETSQSSNTPRDRGENTTVINRNFVEEDSSLDIKDAVPMHKSETHSEPQLSADESDTQISAKESATIASFLSEFATLLSRAPLTTADQDVPDASSGTSEDALITLSRLCGTLSEVSIKDSSVGPLVIGGLTAGSAAIATGSTVFNGTLSRLAAESVARDSARNRELNENDDVRRQSAEARAATKHLWEKAAEERSIQKHRWDSQENTWKTLEREWNAYKTRLECRKLELELKRMGPDQPSDSGLGTDVGTLVGNDFSNRKGHPPPPDLRVSSILHTDRPGPQDGSHGVAGADDRDDQPYFPGSLLQAERKYGMTLPLSAANEPLPDHDTVIKSIDEIDAKMRGKPNPARDGMVEQTTAPESQAIDDHAHITNVDDGSEMARAIGKENIDCRDKLMSAEGETSRPTSPNDTDVSPTWLTRETAEGIEMAPIKDTHNDAVAEDAADDSKYPKVPCHDLVKTSDEDLQDVGAWAEPLTA